MTEMEKTCTNSENQCSHKEFLSRFSKNEEPGKRKLNDDGWGEHGGYMKVKCQKLEAQCEVKKKLSDIFSGISIWVNGYTNPSSDELKRLICEHGGKYQHYFSKTYVTHIIATNLPDGKIRNLKNNDKAIHPNWIIDSVKDLELLPEDKYLIYSAAKRDGNIIDFKLKQKIPKVDAFCDTIRDISEGKVSIVDDNEVSNDSCEQKYSDFFDSGEEDNFSLDHNIGDNAIPSLSMHTYSKSDTSKSILKAGDKNYIEEFYAHSRLHHLSMWKSELKKFAVSIQEKWKSKNYVSNQIKGNNDKLIMHIDMDSFFASVAVKMNPELKGKPIAVCHSGRSISSCNDSWSEIASCSYEARSFGLHNGMLLKDARRLCPQLVCVPYHFDKYCEISQKFYEIISKFTCQVQAVSCDEALLDISELVSPGDDVLQLADTIRQEIFTATQCTASCGIGHSILIARLATRCAKPDGKCYIPKEEIGDFMLSQNVTDLPGIGESIGQKLHLLSIKTCADLQKWLLSSLQKEFGLKFGGTLYKFARGIDQRQIKTDNERKSVSAVINYGMRFMSHGEVEKFVKDLSFEVEKRLKENKKKGKLVTIKIMACQKDASNPSKYLGHGKCDSISKSNVLPYATDDSGVIGETCVRIMHSLKISAEDYRGIGIQVSKLSDSCINTSITPGLIKFAKPVTTAELFERDLSTRLNDNSKKKVNVSPKKSSTIDKFIRTSAATFDKNNQIDHASSSLPKLPSVSFDPSEDDPSDIKNDIKVMPEYIQGVPLDWDPKVLEELPENIRNELLTHQIHQSVKIVKSSSQINVENNSTFHNKLRKNINAKKSPSKRRQGRPKKYINDKTKFSFNKIDQHLQFQKHKVISSDYSTPTSLIDLEIVNELPESMKNEILAEVNKTSYAAVVSTKKPLISDSSFVKCNLPGNQSNDNQMLLSPSQMDQSVLQALPPNIRDDVINDARKMKDKFSLLKSIDNNNINNNNNILNKISTISSSSSPLVCSVGTTTCDATSVCASTMSNLAIVNSLPRIEADTKTVDTDPDVSLISTEDQSSNVGISTRSSITSISDVDNKSMLSGNAKKPGAILVNNINKNNSEILLSPSQIDRNILDALPLSIQQEVLVAAKLEKQKRIRLKENEVRQQEQNDHMDTLNDANIVFKRIKVKQNMPMLYGACSCNEVKKILRNWVNTYSEPLPEDIKEIIDYFHQLLDSFNMESLYLFILFLQRIVSSHSSWYASFNEILKSVQVKMKSSYSGAFPVFPFHI